MKHLTIELTQESIDNAIKVLEAYQEDGKVNKIREKLDKVCKQLADIGAEEARRRFARADHGNGDVTVTVEKMRNGYKIVASGADVYFIEFGTGFFAMPHGDEISVPVYPGSYSEEHAQAFSEHGYWYYAGEKLQGTEAEMPMYFAGEAIRNNEKRILREVYGK